MSFLARPLGVRATSAAAGLASRVLVVRHIHVCCSRKTFTSAATTPTRLDGRFALSKAIAEPRLQTRAIGSAVSPSILQEAKETSAFSSNSQDETRTRTPETPLLSSPAVTKWLLLSASLVFGIIVVGGITRLTESGLSIVEWRPVSGTLPPLSDTEWQEEFEKYKTSPEFKMMNSGISMSEFKRIFYWEYSHRLLGRIIGFAFVVPFTYFALRRRLTPGLTPTLGVLSLLIGAQGVLGWYMVKSGLDDEIITNKTVPRVSQYRLAAHLSTALVLFAGMLATGLEVRMDWNWAQKGTWSGISGKIEPWSVLKSVPSIRRFKIAAYALAGLVFLTACSGAFVAGLDAGLIYNEFPTMGGGLSPPLAELMSPLYATKTDGSDLWWRNIFENPTTTQFDHRVLAMTTYTATTALYLTSIRHPVLRAALPPITRHMILAAFGMANIQVLLGISTLLYLVPVPLAAAHQAGSVALLTALVGLCASLRKPGRAARLVRQHRLRAGLTSKS